MNVLMMTNTFTPHVGGVARSVEAFTHAFRERGHRVLVVAPEFDGMPENELDVVRIPAIQRFNGSDFSVILPVPGKLVEAIDAFGPDIVHSHHPFLVGATAMRISHRRELPLVFTHHTMYEAYTHYAPGDGRTLKRFVVNLSTAYANLCDAVFAPSESVAVVLRRRGVTAPITVVPTGVDVARFCTGSGVGFRAAMRIPRGAFLVGHIGRLAPEKNLGFLARAVAAFLKRNAGAHFLVVGSGPSDPEIRRIFSRAGVAERLHMAGTLKDLLLISAFSAMDVLAFASKSETQGIVLAEAMAAGVPVVALDAPGAREVVSDGVNGRLLTVETADAFAGALSGIAAMAPRGRAALRRAALAAAGRFSMDASADAALAAYVGLLAGGRAERTGTGDDGVWQAARRRIKSEWDVIRSMAEAAGGVFDAASEDVTLQ